MKNYHPDTQEKYNANPFIIINDITLFIPLVVSSKY